MAFFDDPKLLTAHLRHSFITSDDTGMCELIMINEDLDKEIKKDHNLKRSLRLAQRYNPSEHMPRYAKSYDIYASPSLPRRPPLKNDANMFELLEKKKSKSSQMKSVVWSNESVPAFDPEMFPRREVVKKSKESTPSYLSVLLAKHNKLAANPFFEFGRFNGENHGIAVTNTYRIFLSMSKTPLQPITITVLHNAMVNDLIGLTLWKYVEMTKNPVKLKTVKHYSVRIAEEDGDIDTDLPELEREDRIAKFRFKYLGIVEVKRARISDSSPAMPRPVVRVYYEQGGFSTLAITDQNIEMAEILAKVIRKRCLQIHGYELERKDTPGIPVNLDSTLQAQRTLDFVLVKNQGRTKALSMGESDDQSDLPDVKDELTFYQYKSYHITLVNKVRSNSEAILGVSGDRIEVEPVTHTRSFFPRSSKAQKPMTYEVKKICMCELLDDKNAVRRAFRIVRLAKDGSYKNLDFEAPQAVAKEIVRKLNLILDGVSGGARSDFLEWREQNKAKKGSKS